MMPTRSMSKHDQRVIHSSEDPDWRTPPECYQALHEEFDFTVDAAADSTSSLCTYYLGPGSDLGEDTLAVDLSSWPKSHRFFLNPPFSRTLTAAYRTGKIKQDGAWVEYELNPEKARSYEIEAWAEWCHRWSRAGFTIVSILPFAPQTDWYRRHVMGHDNFVDNMNLQDVALRLEEVTGHQIDLPTLPLWSGHAAREERRLPHRISFLRPDGSKAANAGVNSAIVVWKPNPGIVGPWQPHSFYWSYR